MKKKPNIPAPAFRDRKAWILVVLITAMSIFLLWFLSLRSSFTERQMILDRERENLSLLCESLTRQTKELMGSIKLFMDALDTFLEFHPDVDPRFDLEFRNIVEVFRTSRKGTVDIRMVDQNGGLFYIPSKSAAPLAQVSDRDYFKAQQNSETRGFYIANPVISRVTKIWGIPISYPLKKPAKGIVMLFAALEIPNINLLFEPARPKPNGAVSLIRSDGILLSRAPFLERVEGASLLGSQIWTEYSREQEIRLTTGKGADGKMKFIAMAPIEDFPLVLSVTSDFDELIGPWETAFFWKALGYIGLTILLLFLGAQLIRSLRKQNQRQAALDLALIQARDANSAKSRFLAHMSHEIRTPMNGVLGSLELFPRDNLSSDQLEMLEDITKASEGLLTILNDILDLSKVEYGKMTLESMEFSLPQILDDVLTLVRPLSDGKKLPLRLTCPGDFPKVLIGDPTRVRQIIFNLLSNAVKFTSQGSVELKLEKKGEDLTWVRALVVVSDTGKGMGPEVMKQLFQPFVQGDSSITRKFGGTGLGLAIVKSLVDLMDGRISVESVEGEGTRVMVEFTLGKPDHAGSEIPKTDESPVVRYGWRYKGLLVDDSPLNLKIMKKIMDRYELKYSAAQDGKAALELLSQESFDFVMMDCQMPVMDGYTATRELRRLSGQNAKIPVVAMTAEAMAGDRQRCLDAGMDEYISKPVRLNDLAQVLKKFFP